MELKRFIILFRSDCQWNLSWPRENQPTFSHCIFKYYFIIILALASLNKFCKNIIIILMFSVLFRTILGLQAYSPISWEWGIFWLLFVGCAQELGQNHVKDKDLHHKSNLRNTYKPWVMKLQNRIIDQSQILSLSGRQKKAYSCNNKRQEF